MGGSDIITPIIESIDESDLVSADVTVANFNVTYELGFAIGRGKRVLPVRFSGIDSDSNMFQKIGLFDTLVYDEYANSDDLTRLFRREIDTHSRFSTDFGFDPQPIYVLLPPYANDEVGHMMGRIKKSGIRARTFDPTEESRMAVRLAVRSVASSVGVVVPLLAPGAADEHIHNIRAAFIAGLAHGMGKATLLLQRGNWPTPLDVRDQVERYERRDQMDAPIQSLVERTMDIFYAPRMVTRSNDNLLASLNLGDPSAENEEVQLNEYFLERDEFRQVLDGRARIVVGRKGSGKTAVFVETRDRHRASRGNIVVDMSPEGYQLRKFKDLVLGALAEGSKEHLLSAFWEYVLLLETCVRILKVDEDFHKRNHRLYEPYQRLLRAYRSESAASGIDSSERIGRLIENVAKRYRERFGRDSNVTLGESHLTNLIYEADLPELRRLVEVYVREKDAVYILVDNLDKGWNANGLEHADIVIIRTLMEASRKLERSFTQVGIRLSTVVFLRNDIYDVLLSETSDRGKETTVAVDWNQGELLRQMLRRRFVFNGLSKSQSVQAIWHQLCVGTVNGEDSLGYLIDRSLMRPRYLLRLINHCRGNAVNFGRARIDEQDIHKGLSVYSTDIITEIDLEIRDVLPGAGEILYSFLGEPRQLNRSKIESLIEKGIGGSSDAHAVFRLLLWHGVIGLLRPSGDEAFIYNLNYDLKRLMTLLAKTEAEDPAMVINPAFSLGLELT